MPSSSLPLLTFSFPWRTVNGQMPAQVSEEDSIRESVANLLTTPLQTRIMRYRLGTNALRYTFQNDDPNLEETLRFDASRVLRQFEPRIVVVAINKVPRTSRDEGITIEVQYQIRATLQQDAALVSLTGAGSGNP